MNIFVVAEGGLPMLRREAVSIFGPIVKIFIPLLDHLPKIFYGPATLHDATIIHNALHHIVKDFVSKLPLSAGLASINVRI